ncbi:FadR/GntR family transcriptional regulator [Lentibacillus sp. N15]|uniref:FadR/GntR family transcriptional regulator n=1 Tax=Lentibacillus songyuanensis TaxID=3136161 RepID=UPI0031B9DB22
MLKKTNRVSLVDQVVAQMEDLIESGQWPIGKKLPPEMELMEEFDVSRNTLREAIHALVHAGLLETKQGSGTVVCSSSALGAAINRRIKKSSLIETLEVRLALEREAAQIAATQRKEEDLANLQACIEQCQTVADNGDIEKFVQADITFHKAIVRSTNNQLLQDLYEYMTDPIYSSIRDIMIMDTPFDYEKEIHYELVRAIRDRDVEGAALYVDAYMDDFKKRLQ